MRNIMPTLVMMLIATQLLSAKDPDRTTPKATLQSYIEAVKAGDYETAKKCWTIEGTDKDAALEVLVGYWTSHRRARLAVIREFGRDGTDVLGKFNRTDLTDEALDLTLNRVKDTEVEIKGIRALLRIQWKADDGTRAFLFTNDPIPFQKIEDSWRLDATAEAGGNAESVLKQGTWGPLFRDYAAMMNEVADGVESGKLKSKDDVKRLIEERSKAAAIKYKAALEEQLPAKKPK
jgi:hypothetical protein